MNQAALISHIGGCNAVSDHDVAVLATLFAVFGGEGLMGQLIAVTVQFVIRFGILL